MNKYLKTEVEKILKTYDNYPVIIVEAISDNPLLDELKFAVTTKTGGYSSIELAEQIGFTDADTIGVTFECLEIMQRYRETSNIQNEPTMHSFNNSQVVDSKIPSAQFFGLLFLFSMFVLFIISCFVG